jgi:hypothetical protein
LGEEIDVHFVHGSEIFHVGEVDIVLDHLLEGGSGELEHLFEVLQDLSLWI